MLLLINGNPRLGSFTSALADAYQRGAAQRSDLEIVRLDLHALDFDPILHHGYHQRTPHEPDLEQAMALFKRAEQVVFLYPVWWGSMPALLKGFLDRVFLPGHFFQYHENGLTWDKLMRGKRARVIMTMDAPVWYDRLIYGSPARRAMKRLVLDFCGFRSRFTTIGAVKHLSEAKRGRWLQRVERLGKKEGERSAARSNALAVVG